MATKMFVNLPVRDLTKSIAFYTAIGFTLNKQFTDDTAASMVISEHNYATLLTHEKFKSFTTKPLPDSRQTTGVVVALALDNTQAVDDMVTKAVGAGGKEPKPKQDYGFMVLRTFEDLDGHTWEPFYMDPAHVQKS